MNAGLYLLTCLFGFAAADEPVCISQFDYEYRTAQKLSELERKMEEMSFKGGVSVYVRFGRNSCPSEASLVYHGYAGGKKWNDKGSGSNTLCLPSDPTWSRYKDGNDGSRGRLYGTETDMHDSKIIFDDDVNEQDTPCAVCMVQRSVTLMIPGRSNCYPDWRLEYSGYLMSAYYDHVGPHNYICVDGNPEFVPHGGKNDNQHILYLVEAQCGSLPCPPYVQGRELACVVCSK